MKKTMLFLTACLFVSGGLLTAQQPAESPPESRITMPWEEFKKLLGLGDNEIVVSLETYQKLVAQTGAAPAVKPVVQDGNVILSRSEFEKLVNRMKPPVGDDIRPPFDFLVTRALYTGRMQPSHTMFTGSFTIHILKTDAYVRVPLLMQDIAVEDVRIDGKEALMVNENGYHTLIFRQPGEYHVTARFSMKSALEKGPHRIDLNIQRTPITLLQLDIPMKDIDVDIPQARQVETTPVNANTRINAVIAPGNQISVMWRKKLAVTEQLPPKLYSEVFHLISIDDDALRCNSQISLNILHNEIDKIRIRIPEGMSVLSVSGEGVGEWQETGNSSEGMLQIPFTYGKKGNVNIYVQTEQPLSGTGAHTSFSGLEILDVVRETGFIGIELNTSAELKVTDMTGIEKIPVQKLPPSLINRSAKPLFLGFKYLRHPYTIVLNIEKHRKIPVPVATIHSANIVTLFTEDGKVVHRLIYQVRNNAKQFLEIQLPDEAVVWSVFVSNEPVESSLNDEGRLLVPLIRSQAENNRLSTFPVEVIYCLVEKPFAALKTLQAGLPSVDLITSQLIWSVYLPNDYTYLHFESTLEKEEIIRGIHLLAGSARNYDEEAKKELWQRHLEQPGEIRQEELNQVYKGKNYKSRFRNVPMDEAQIQSQVEAELDFSGRMDALSREGLPQAAMTGSGGTAAGVLPMQIKVPTTGQVYRFAKTIVMADDPLHMEVIYARQWIIRWVRWIFWLMIAFLVYMIRKPLLRILNRLKNIWGGIEKTYRKKSPAIRKTFQSGFTQVVIAGLFVTALFISRRLAVLVFLILWISLAYYLLSKRKTLAGKRSPTPARKKRT